MSHPPVTLHPADADRDLPEKDRQVALLRWIAERIQALADSRPRTYIMLATLCAAAGYGYLLLFPCLVTAGIAGIYQALFTYPTVAWDGVLTGTTVAALAGLTSYRIFRFRPAPPGGLPLDRAMAPALWQLLAEQAAQYRSVSIERIVLTDRFELDILKTPRGGLPTWSDSTLAIGLPLLQCLSAAQFRCALARRLGQFSGRYNWLENRLYRLRNVWPLYGTHCASAGPGYQPVRWFFTAYAAVYREVTLPVARCEELAADAYAMELYSDEQVLDTITTEMVCRTFLAERYWPAVREIEAREGRPVTVSHAGMARVLHAGLRDERVDEWLARARSAMPAWNDPVPTLTARIANIGHSETRMSPLAADPAAATYLAAVPVLRDATAAPDDVRRVRRFLDGRRTVRPAGH